MRRPHCVLVVSASTTVASSSAFFANLVMYVAATKENITPNATGSIVNKDDPPPMTRNVIHNQNMVWLKNNEHKQRFIDQKNGDQIHSST